MVLLTTGTAASRLFEPFDPIPLATGDVVESKLHDLDGLMLDTSSETWSSNGSCEPLSVQ